MTDGQQLETDARPVILLAMSGALADRLFSPAGLTELRGWGDVVLSPAPAHYLTAASRPVLARAEVIVTGWGSPPIDAAVLDAAPRLRAVVHAAGSVRGVVGDECFARRVAVSSQAAANAVPVAEYTLAMILLSAKQAFRAQHDYRARRTFDVQSELAEAGAFRRRVGLIGASTVGRRVMRLLRPFELEVVVADPTVSADEVASLGARLRPLDAVLRTSAVVSLHAPLLPGTRNMIGAEQLALLPAGATLINTARGGLIDQVALLDELLSGRISAVLDVTDPEPPAPDSPLWQLPNVVLTPHIAGAAGTELRRIGASAVAEVGRVLQGRPFEHEVTRERYGSVA